MLGDRDKRHAMPIEKRHHLGEVRDAARDPVQLVHDHHIDLYCLDGCHQPLGTGALEHSTGNIRIAVSRPVACQPTPA